MNIELSQKEVNLLLESMSSYKQSIAAASLKIKTQPRMADMAEVQRNIFTLTRKLQDASRKHRTAP